MSEINISKIEKKPLYLFAQKAYFKYAKYVIADRALPNIGDGLKPVQRRIIYAMSELNLMSSAKYKKSARTVGDVLGKFHPHGDTACYQAMVLMAQNFSYRYPIVDGQGNWGALEDPKSFAAMRYTEAKLSKYAETLLLEIDMGTVNWEPNFDGTLKEPKQLPARLPNILLNGSTGIAVGMSTNIPPHNIIEVAKTCIKLLDNPNIHCKDIIKFISGPDFPTGGKIVTPKKEIIDVYSKGKGTIRIRGSYQIEKNDIIITELPYQGSPLKITEQIINQIKNKKLPSSLRVRDEADHKNPVRLVIVPPKSIKDISALMSHLFATTDLEKTIRINMNVIGEDGKPEIKGLVKLLNEWLLFRKKTVRNRLTYKLKKVLISLEVIKGLLISHLNAGEIIKIIQTHKNPTKIIKKSFNLTDKQTEAILELKLRSLARLEVKRIESRQNKLIKEEKKLKKILASKEELKKLIKRELGFDIKKYGDKRRTSIAIGNKAKAFSEGDLIQTNPITVILSKKGWTRIAQGFDVDCKNLTYKPGDQYLSSDKGFNTEKTVFLNSSGRVYALYPYTLPSIRSQGEPLSSRFETPSGTTFNSVIICNKKTQLLVSSTLGFAFITKQVSSFSVASKGKALLSLTEEAKALPGIKIKNIKTDLVAIFTSTGRLLVFQLCKIPILTRGKGSKIIKIDKQKERVKMLTIISAKADIIVIAGNQFLKITQKNINQYLGKKGSLGKKLPRGFQRITDVKTGI